MPVTMNEQEQDVRLKMLNTFLTCPHRDTNEVAEVHKELREADPVFFPHLAAWYNRNGDIRDFKEVFAAMLITDPYIQNREAGLALFRESPIYMKERIKGFIKGKAIKKRVKTGEKMKIGRKSIDKTKIEKIQVGLKQNMPTAFRKEINTFLDYLEADNDRFDSAVIKAANSLKGLYASVHRRPPERHNNVLFLRKYPEDSKLAVYKKIIGAESPEIAAKLIVENKIPYRIAVGLIDKITPTVLAALINAMSPQEAINNVASLKAQGAYDNEDLKKLVESKLEKAKKSKNVSALKSKVAKDTGRIQDEDIAKKLDEISDNQIRSKGTIKVATALLVDKSSSMHAAIEVGKRVASIVSGIADAPLHVMAFDDMVTPITSQGETFSDWERAFSGIRAHGWTSMGRALEYMIRQKIYADQIVVITDEGENQPQPPARGSFVSFYPQYCEVMKTEPNVVVIHVDSSYERTDRFSKSLKAAGVETDVYRPKGDDYYGLPGLVPLLTRQTKLDLLYEIMATPLPVRKPYN